VDPSLARVIETRVGEPLAMPAVRDTITHLFSLGRFDDVRVDATVVEANRVALRYELSPIHPVTRIAFDSGQVGRAGQVLVELDTSVERAQLSSAIARRDLALANVRRSRALVSASVMPSGQLDTDEAGVRTSAADVVFSDRSRSADDGRSIDVVGTPVVSRRICSAG
jgi:multidrug efflux pump subunit AcrA (membrane-fusion protein)